MSSFPASICWSSRWSLWRLFFKGFFPNKFTERFFRDEIQSIFFDIIRKKRKSQYFLMVAPEHYCLVNSKRDWMVFGDNSFLWSLLYKQHIKTSRFLLKLYLFYLNRKKVPTVPSLALKTLETVSASKRKFVMEAFSH